MIRKRDRLWGSSEKTALELRWRRVAYCSRGSFQPPEMHKRQQWTAVYVGSQQLWSVAEHYKLWSPRHFIQFKTIGSALTKISGCVSLQNCT